ncbi:MAG: serine hydrolase [Gemmatimonadaceae bacterium]|nr:serine hydrolase [Gemmatimonadaceae bacterium]
MSARHLLSALLVAATPLQAQNGQTVDWREFDAYVAKAARDWNVPGLAIAVVHRGQLLFAKGYGVREIGTAEAVDTQTIFAIASTTKAITAAALGMLVDEGKVRWDDPVTKFVPTFQMFDPWATRETTVRDLITHRAGLPNADYLWTGGDLSRAEVIRRIRFIQPSYSFRGGYVYHNVMYTVAGAVIEAASGFSWDDFVRTRIFQPLGMTRSVTTLAEALTKANRAMPHGSRGDTLKVSGNSLADAIGPAGSVWSSVADMSKWVRFLLDTGRVNGKALLTPRTWAELFRPVTIMPPWNENSAPQLRLARPHFRTYALGWFQQDYLGRQVDFHTGSLTGMIAINGLIREEGIGVYILSNTSTEIRHPLMFRVFDHLLGAPPRDWSGEMLALQRADDARDEANAARAGAARVEGTSPTLPLERYAGVFTDSLYPTVTVTHENGRLRYRFSSTQAGTLEHWQYDTFRVLWDDWWRGRTTVTFGVGANGSADRLDVAGFELRRARR